MKKISLILLVIGILLLSGYVYLRSALRTPGFQPHQPHDEKTSPKPAESALDLRPLFIKKLQEIVKLGSGGLYDLSIHEVEPDVLGARVTIKDAELVPDTAVLLSLQKAHKAPASVYRIHLGALTLEGLGLKDILDKKRIDLSRITVRDPQLDVYSTGQHNKTNDEEQPGTLYQRIREKLEHLGIDSIRIDGGRLVHHNVAKRKMESLNQITVRLSDILMDSSTQYDKKRFLFARQALLSIKDYSMPSRDGMYDLHIASVEVAATRSELRAKNISWRPRLGKKEFGRKLGFMKERYELFIPELHLTDMDWWDLVNREKFIARKASIRKARFSIYLDRSLPPDGIHLNTFPSQLLMKLPSILNISRVDCHDLEVVYEEFNPTSGQTGKFYVDHLNGTILNLTNIPGAIQKNHLATVKANGLFLGRIPARVTFRFDLARYRKGVFTADAHISHFPDTAINSVTTPLGLFRMKEGMVDSIQVQEAGNETGATGKVLLLYRDLKIVPLEKDKHTPGGLNPRHFSGFVANEFILKHENPRPGETPREGAAAFTRDPRGSFMNLFWKTALTGILRTVGAPQRLAKSPPVTGAKQP
ncbi:MAG: hypothetical protein ACXVBI_08865 [Flavisolibacter sp.]